jgi:uncharacterized protein involved in exopolysaccharide biosynthesis
MSSSPRSIVNPRQIVTTLRRHFWLWLAPTIALTVLATAYGILRPVKWRASQALVVRDEASGGTARQGRFDTIEALKSAQETVLEMAKNPRTIKAALIEAGPLDGITPNANWPGKDDIESLQSSISVSPPKGSEFGRSEVIYLSAEGPTSERAVRLTNAVCNQLEIQLQELRQAKAQSLVAELEKAVTLAQNDLSGATVRLRDIEKLVGSDIDELRSLTETTAGTSNLRAVSNQLQEELRRTQLVYDTNEETLKLLTAARADHNRLLAAPQRLFEQQPALRRLKDGLVDAQLRTAQLFGRMSADHPEVKAARLAEEKIRVQLNAEIDLVVSNLRNELTVSTALLNTLKAQHQQVQTRLAKVAELRADYSNQLALVRQRTENLAKANKDLAEVRASQAAALSSSVIARIDEVQPDNSPVGPRFLAIVVAGLGGGLVLGFGLVFLMAPLGNLWGRRWTDYVAAGRRVSDQPANTEQSKINYGRRKTDLSPAGSAGDARSAATAVAGHQAPGASR